MDVQEMLVFQLLLNFKVTGVSNLSVVQEHELHVSPLYLNNMMSLCVFSGFI